MERAFYFTALLKPFSEIRIPVRTSAVSNIYFVINAIDRERRNAFDLNGERRPLGDFRLRA